MSAGTCKTPLCQGTWETPLCQGTWETPLCQLGPEKLHYVSWDLWNSTMSAGTCETPLCQGTCTAPLCQLYLPWSANFHKHMHFCLFWCPLVVKWQNEFILECLKIGLPSLVLMHQRITKLWHNVLLIAFGMEYAFRTGHDQDHKRTWSFEIE